MGEAYYTCITKSDLLLGCLMMSDHHDLCNMFIPPADDTYGKYLNITIIAAFISVIKGKVIPHVFSALLLI